MGEYHDDRYDRGRRVENHYYDRSPGAVSYDQNGISGRQFDDSFRSLNRTLDDIDRRQRDATRLMIQVAVSLGILITVLFIVLIITYWG